MRKQKIAVIFGGRSAEREVSLRTGEQIIKNLERKKYRVLPIEISKQGNAWVSKLLNAKPDVAVLALHGQFGEDGTIQGMLEMLDIPYTCSGVFTSALAMDKYRMKEFLKSSGIHMPKGMLLRDHNIAQIRRTIGYPCIVKPNRLGSSVGVTVNIRSDADLRRAIKIARRYDHEILVEEYIHGREITAGVLGNTHARALPLIEIVPRIGNFYNYESKYAPGGSDHVIPAPISKTMKRTIQNLAVHIHELVGGRGVTRSDFIVRGTTPYFLELNTIPGMTKTSLVPDAASHAGIPFAKLLDRLIELAHTK